MPGNLNKIWEAISGNKAAILGAWRAKSFTSKRAWYSMGNLAARPASRNFSDNPRMIASYATRALAGAATGAMIGGGWGAVSDNETILGGAMKGAFVGAAGRVSARGLNFKAARGMTRLSQVRSMRDNLQFAWGAMNSGRVRGMRNWVVGSSLLGAAQGMISGEDNPVGGAVGGAISGGIRGAAMYGAYRGLKRWRGMEGPVRRGRSLTRPGAPTLSI